MVGRISELPTFLSDLFKRKMRKNEEKCIKEFTKIASKRRVVERKVQFSRGTSNTDGDEMKNNGNTPASSVFCIPIIIS